MTATTSPALTVVPPPTHPPPQAVAQALASRRAEAAAAGSLPVLVSLCQSEVAGLSTAAAEAVGRHVMQLQAQARLLTRQAAAGQLDLAGLSPAEADALAWQVHTGGVSAAEDLVGLVLVQVRTRQHILLVHDVRPAYVLRFASVCLSGITRRLASPQPAHVLTADQSHTCVMCVYMCQADAITAQHVAEVDAAGGALSALAAGFELEEATSRRSTAAPPSPYLMAGEGRV